MTTKFTSFILVLLLSMAVVLPSCKKDKDTPKNEFTLNGETYSLAKGFIENYGDNPEGSYDFDVTLTSSGINASVGGDFTGIGDLVYLDLNTSSATGLVEGTYNFSSTRNAFTIVDGVVGENLNLSTLEGETFDATGGTVTVELDGNETTLTFTLQIAGSTVTGYYKGVLQTI